MEDGGRKSFRREELDQEFYLSGKNGFLVPYLEGIQKDLSNYGIDFWKGFYIIKFKFFCGSMVAN